MQRRRSRESEERFRAIFEHSAVGVAQIDTKTGQFLRINKKFCDIVGYTRDEMTAATFMKITHPDDLKTDLDNIEKLKAGKIREFTYEKRYFRKDGSIVWVNLALSPMWDIDQKPTYHIAVIEDITERKRLESQLQQAHKMEAIGTLSGGIAHDFNNILGIIVGNTEIAMMDVPEWSPARGNLEEVRKACIRARDLVRQILAFSRMSTKELKPLRLSPIIKESLKLLRSSIPTTIEIRRNISSKSDTINADPTEINQILLNLCTNAAHAMREKGGILEVSLEDAEIDEEAVTLHHGLTPGRYIRLTVSDTGNGIEPGIMERIFDPYFTTKEVGEGTGMGLAVAQGIIKNHGGALSVKSKPGEGATFYVFLPITEIESEGELETIESLPKGNERILFVDDEKAMVDAVQPMLEHLGYKVTARTSSIEALEAFSNKQNAFDLVITDMTMPNMAGIDLTKELLKIRPDIPIILCTGYSEMIDKDKAKKLGISKFAMKPLVLSEIAVTIREVLGKK
jgi:PAS domain S-box-containing protein